MKELIASLTSSKFPLLLAALVELAPGGVVEYLKDTAARPSPENTVAFAVSLFGMLCVAGFSSSRLRKQVEQGEEVVS
ncbi:hypothetical protein PQR71_18020 [Paraburkholderia fungorum]|uniref:hypothetical protein n=1 Tax=Paraburkholderia fungorum TaxID=134537 RepID=UPI0038BBDBC5